MKLKTIAYHTILICSIAIACGSCTSKSKNNKQEAQHSIVNTSEFMPEMDKSIMVIFQDSRDNYWFGTKEQGAYRYDGQRLLHFTTKDGLSSNGIRAIQEDKSGNIYFDTGEGINKFDGQTVSKLELVEVDSPSDGWQLTPDDLWFGGKWNENGPYRYDGETLYHLKFPKHPREDEFYGEIRPICPISPYGIYFIYKDRKGNIWFGTSNLGDLPV